MSDLYRLSYDAIQYSTVIIRRMSKTLIGWGDNLFSVPSDMACTDPDEISNCVGSTTGRGSLRLNLLY